MAHRHKKAKGGGVAPKHDADKKEYNAQGSHVMNEAHEKKRGGKTKHEHKATGGAAKPRLDKRARGGGVHASGKDMTSSPFSSAHLKGHLGPASHPHAHARGGKVGN